MNIKQFTMKWHCKNPQKKPLLHLSCLRMLADREYRQRCNKGLLGTAAKRLRVCA